jgi:hypothetical protein
MKLFKKILIGIYHARYHKNLKLAELAKNKKNIKKFKKYVYRAEDAWRQVVILTETNKK